MEARRLLAQAITLYDDPKLPFARLAVHEGWRTGFDSGAAWMCAVMEHQRNDILPSVHASYNLLGFFKYGLSALGALLYLALVIGTGWWPLLPGFVLVFYAIEAQMVFLFPLVIDGCPDALRQSRAWTVRAGGTIPVMWTVMQLAVVMLFGGFVGQGFTRSWALGCLSIVLWYEELRHAEYRVAG